MNVVDVEAIQANERIYGHVVLSQNILHILQRHNGMAMETKSNRIAFDFGHMAFYRKMNIHKVKGDSDMSGVCVFFFLSLHVSQWTHFD